MNNSCFSLFFLTIRFFSNRGGNARCRVLDRGVVGATTGGVNSDSLMVLRDPKKVWFSSDDKVNLRASFSNSFLSIFFLLCCSCLLLYISNLNSLFIVCEADVNLLVMAVV